MENSCEAVGKHYRDTERGVSHGTTRGDKGVPRRFPYRLVLAMFNFIKEQMEENAITDGE